MRPSRVSRLALFGAAAAWVACASARPPLPQESNPVSPTRAAPPPLADEMERTASDLAALVLADRPDSAAAMLIDLERMESIRRREGGTPAGLTDNGRDLLHTLVGRRAYIDHAGRMLEEEELDPVLRHRLEETIEQDPLERADRRLREDRVRKVAVIFNRLAAPLARLASGAGLNPIDAGRAAVSALLALTSFPDATVQERQALQAYREFLRRNPDAPEAPWVAERVERYEKQRRLDMHDDALEAAERSLEAGRPDIGLAHIERAERLLPGDREVDELRGEARARNLEREARVARTMDASLFAGIPLDPRSRFEFQGLLTATLAAPAEEVLARADSIRARQPATAVSDDLDLLRAIGARDSGDEEGYFAILEEIARDDSGESNMTRHARWLLADPQQDPYRHYRAARRADRAARTRHLLLGRHQRGPQRRGLPRPLEWLLDAPGMAVSFALTPLRILQYPSARSRFGGNVIVAGERYLHRFPDGAHAAEIHGDLEKLYVSRGRWSGALEHHQALPSPDAATVTRYRERVAEQALAAARTERRWDARMQLYRWVQKEYPETPQARVAAMELHELIEDITPQSIRLSKGFLAENPEIAGPGALGLRPELMDGEEDNGELGEQGVMLIGLTYVRVSLEGREPVIERLPEQNFSRLVALTEEAYYRRLATDERERPEPDPQRDLFFERARLGLLDRPDMRPTATSEATFLSSREKYGYGRRTSILPVEVVVAGDLEGLGLSAYPRMKVPRETEDAWLYR